MAQKAAKSRQGVAWGLGGGIIASLCCLGPMVAVALGLGGASLLLGLAAYRPYFLGAGLLLVGLGVFLMLRRSYKCCTLAEHRRNLWRYPLLAMVTFALVFGLFQYILPGMVYDRLSPPPAAEAPVPERIAVARLEIKGMT